jgi:hypothetical protein
VITELESHTSQQALIPQHESKLGEEPQFIWEVEHGQSRLQVGAEEDRGEGELTQRLGATTMAWRGSAHAATMAPS